jgi:hypothetical protein
MSNLKIKYPKMGEHILFSLSRLNSPERGMSISSNIYFRTHPGLRKRIKKTISDLCQKGFVYLKDGRIFITQKGNNFLSRKQCNADEIADGAAEELVILK